MEPRRISVERKYNDKYCQIHINLSRASNNIKIFFKSGKDSIIDRVKFYRVMRDSLALDIINYKIKKYILEGELLI
jgi:DNA ligase 4